MNDARPAVTPDRAAVCPFLGLADDPGTRALGATAAHRCFRAESPQRISVQHQTVLCMSDCFASCSRYRPVLEPADAPAVGSRMRAWQFAALAAAILVGAGGVYLAVGNPFTAEPAPAGGRAAGDNVAPARSAAPAISAGHAAFPEVTPGGTGAATPPAPVGAPATPGPTLVATPMIGLAYTVQAGDSLTALADRFRIAVDVLAAANGLSPTALLDVGQQLRIPSAPTSTPAPP